MVSNPFSRSLESVTDPTDWKCSRIPELADLDSLLRCFICKEFLKAPVMTGCNHTFCSQCIREYLITNSHCPLCDSEQYESNLKRVIQLEEVVLCYSKLRPTVMQCLELPPPSTDIIEIPDEDETEPAATATKKRILTSNLVAVEEAVPTRDQMVECPICNKIMSAEILQANHIDNCLETQASISRPTKRTRASNSLNQPNNANNISSFFLANTPSTNSISETSPYKRRATQDFYFLEATKHHSDQKKLPKLDFSSLTTSRLKEKLANLKISTQGSRIQLELRYNQYYILYNANLDSNHPVPDKVLKQRLNQWELSHLTFAQASTNSLFDTGGNTALRTITDKNFLVSEWTKRYRKEFARLTRLAKASATKKAKLQEPAGNTVQAEGETMDDLVKPAHNDPLEKSIDPADHGHAAEGERATSESPSIPPE